MEIMPIFAQKIPFGRVKCYNGRSAVFCAPQTAPEIVRLTASGRAMREKSAPRSLAYHGETGTDVRCTSKLYYNKPPPRFASIFFIFSSIFLSRPAASSHARRSTASSHRYGLHLHFPMPAVRSCSRYRSFRCPSQSSPGTYSPGGKNRCQPRYVPLRLAG